MVFTASSVLCVHPTNTPKALKPEVPGPLKLRPGVAKLPAPWGEASPSFHLSDLSPSKKLCLKLVVECQHRLLPEFIFLLLC